MQAAAFHRAIVDSLEIELSKADNLKDSLSISFNLFDASARARQMERAENVLKLAIRANDVSAQLDILRNLANLNDANDSLYNYYISVAQSLPRSSKQKQTILYIKVMQNTDAARTSTVEQNRERMRELMKRVEASEGRSVTTRLEGLFALCAYIEQFPVSELLTDYLQQIGELLYALPERIDALESLYLTQSSLTYTAMLNRKKAIEADERLLRHINTVQAKSAAAGRPYRDFSYSKYVVYRRLLGNYAALSPEEVDKYYNAAREVSQFDPLAKDDFENIRRPDIYYYMSHKDYAAALPLIKREVKQTDHDLLPYVRRLLLNAMIEAADALGDRDALLDALLAMRELDASEQTRLSVESFRELQLIYENSTKKLHDTQQELEKRNAQISVTRTLGGAFVVILLIFMLLIVRVWRRTKMLNNQLTKTNVKLTEERDSLRRIQADLIRTGERARAADKMREQFINNMSHEVSTPLNAIVEYSNLIVDCMDENKKPYLMRFATVIKLNTELLLTLVNDVLDMASIDKKTLKIEKQPVIVSNLAEIAADTFKSRLQPGVRFVNRITPDSSFIISTDEKRVTQVLLNLLVNAAKFTPEGSVTLDGKLINDGNMYQFSVTDTGVGIPEGKEEIIFERFEKLNRYSQGIGLGLSVSRMIAILLGGEVKVDTTHKGPGARFIFTIPVK